MKRTDEKYQEYLHILKEELVPAFGCTEPIAIAFAAACVRQLLGVCPDSLRVEASGNIIKNVKSVIVPNTGGMKGIRAAAAAGALSGQADRRLEVLAGLTGEDHHRLRDYLEQTPIQVDRASGSLAFDLTVAGTGEGHSARVRIAGSHTNVVLAERDGQILLRKELADSSQEEDGRAELQRVALTIEGIMEFARSVELADVEAILKRQIQYNTAIAEEGLRGDYGANVGSVLLAAYGEDVKIRARAMAAAGSDARMNGCELPVIINSGSGNQGLTVSLPVIEYAKELNSTEEELYRALVVSNLTSIHLKEGIGRLSAYCGAVTAGAGAAAGISFLMGGGFREAAHTVVNTLANVSGIICDGAKPSCAAKISSAVEAGILGLYMFQNGQEFRGGDGILRKGVESTIANVARLGREGMRGTDREILEMMMED